MDFPMGVQLANGPTQPQQLASDGQLPVAERYRIAQQQHLGEHRRGVQQQHLAHQQHLAAPQEHPELQLLADRQHAEELAECQRRQELGDRQHCQLIAERHQQAQSTPLVSNVKSTPLVTSKLKNSPLASNVENSRSSAASSRTCRSSAASSRTRARQQQEIAQAQELAARQQQEIAQAQELAARQQAQQLAARQQAQELAARQQAQNLVDQQETLLASDTTGPVGPPDCSRQDNIPDKVPEEQDWEEVPDQPNEVDDTESIASNQRKGQKPSVGAKKAPVGAKGRRPRARLAPDLLDSMKGLELDQLRKKLHFYAQYKRLQAEDRIALDAVYYQFQKAVHLLALERLLNLSPVLKYLGCKTRFCGSTNYNNFCEYDVEARKYHYDNSISPDDRKQQCGRLWALLDKDTKEKFKDPDYLETLPNPFGRDNAKKAPKITGVATFRNSKTERWSRKVILDHTKSGPDIISGGSALGVQFLDMFSKQMDPQMSFLRFVSGQKVIRKASGKAPVVINQRKTKGAVKDAAAVRNHSKGEQPDKVELVREKLNEMISNTSHGVYNKWPGTNTASKLAERKLLPQMNNILLGFAKGLVVLRGPPRGDVPTTLGADPTELECADGTNAAVEDVDREITAPTSPETSGTKKTLKRKTKNHGAKKSTSASKKRLLQPKTCLSAVGSESESEAPTPSTSEDEGPSERGLGALGADVAPPTRTIPTRSKTALKSISKTQPMRVGRTQ
ncbi:hypothetical protein PSHT_11406 [Puccinia striiformis]|uniref:Uncharacterized protein n=1 Tax=Puccinia striiformis TaxID=27350 RepID=A0A2S4V3X7_9BASI|nr:hypothetical protein PSHT_11406 [Puccinia striiformis]